jgi:hypothetical protein
MSIAQIAQTVGTIVLVLTSLGSAILYLDRRLRAIETVLTSAATKEDLKVAEIALAQMTARVGMIYDFWKHTMERRSLLDEQRSRDRTEGVQKLAPGETSRGSGP